MVLKPHNYPEGSFSFLKVIYTNTFSKKPSTEKLFGEPKVVRQRHC